MSISNYLHQSKSIQKMTALLIIAALVGGCSSSSKKKNLSNQEVARQQVEEIYNRGKKALDRGNYSFAVEYYQALQAAYPYGMHTEQAKLDMIFAFDKLGQRDKAVDMAENFISLYPTHKNVDYAYYMKGVANFEKKASRLDRMISGGNKAIRDPEPFRKSEAAFNELLKRYPQSAYAGDAKQRMVYINNALAKRELAIAQSYYDTNVYVAALNRCKTVVYQYETSPAVEGALALMERTYLEMGMKDLASSTHEVLVSNFPETQSEPFKAQRKGILANIGKTFNTISPF